MTALEQALSQELQQEKQLNTKIISTLDKQELEFLQTLQNEQRLYEENIKSIIISNQQYVKQLHQEYQQMMKIEREAYLTKLEKISEPSTASNELQNELQNELEKLGKRLYRLEVELQTFLTEERTREQKEQSKRDLREILNSIKAK